jgi:hypothetical protein
MPLVVKQALSLGFRENLFQNMEPTLLEPIPIALIYDSSPIQILPVVATVNWEWRYMVGCC